MIVTDIHSDVLKMMSTRVKYVQRFTVHVS